MLLAFNYWSSSSSVNSLSHNINKSIYLSNKHRIFNHHNTNSLNLIWLSKSHDFTSIKSYFQNRYKYLVKKKFAYRHTKVSSLKNLSLYNSNVHSFSDSLIVKFKADTKTLTELPASLPSPLNHEKTLHADALFFPSDQYLHLLWCLTRL